MKWCLNVIVILSCLFEVTNVCATTTPDRQLFGYQIGNESYLVIDIKDNKNIDVWIQDPRISSLPMLVSRQMNFFAVESFQLPRPDFTSLTESKISSISVDFRNTENAIRNLKTDGLFVIPYLAKEANGKVKSRNLVIPLREIFETQNHSSFDLYFIPPRSQGYPFRRFQSLRTVEGYDLISVLDSNVKGESKSFMFLQNSRTSVIPLENEWVDLNQIHGHLYVSSDQKALMYEGEVLFDFGDRLAVSEENIKMRKSSHLLSSGKAVEFTEFNYLIPGWDKMKNSLGLEPNDHNFKQRASDYAIVDFLMRRGQAPLKIDEKTYKYLITNENTKESVAKWVAHAKLQISPLGVMTYQDSPSLKPLFLGVIINDNFPVGIDRIGQNLQITFDNGNVTQYDSKTGKKRFEYNRRSNTKLCSLLFF